MPAAKRKRASGRRVKKTLESIALRHLWKLLEEIFHITPDDIELKLLIDEELDQIEDCYAETRVKLDEAGGRHTFVVRITPKALLSDSVLKGTCAHESLHIALIYYGLMNEIERFWEALSNYFPKAIDILQRTYGTADEFIVGILEPLVALYLIPSPEPLDKDRMRAWVVTIHQPVGDES